MEIVHQDCKIPLQKHLQKNGVYILCFKTEHATIYTPFRATRGGTYNGMWKLQNKESGEESPSGEETCGKEESCGKEEISQYAVFKATP